MPKPNPKQKWAQEHDQCAACSSSRRPHYARGLCEPCWRSHRSKERWASMSKHKKLKRLRRMRQYWSQYAKTRRKQAQAVRP